MLSSLANTSHDRIVSMSGLQNANYTPIIGTQYATRNYLTRNVVNVTDLQDRKGGDEIDLLTVPTSKYIGK